MRLENLFHAQDLNSLLQSLMPDFVIAFVLFASVSFNVLGKQFDNKRTAVAVSISIGLALSIGLVWWERANGFSIIDLGPIAVGLALILIAFIMYQAIKLAGGTWAGASITIGASILISKLIGVDIPIDSDVIQSVTITALIIGLFAFLMHKLPHKINLSSEPLEPLKKSSDMTRLFRDRHLSKDLGRNMKKVRRESSLLNDRPEDIGSISKQIKRMLPAQGYLTERMARLRTKAHQIRNGHIARLEETKKVFAKLPASAKKKAAADLVAKYNQLIGIDTRLERLDKTAAENELRIKELSQQAQTYTSRHQYEKLTHTLKLAEKLQKHNTRLFKNIEQTEKKLIAIVQIIASEVRKYDKSIT